MIEKCPLCGCPMSIDANGLFYCDGLDCEAEMTSSVLAHIKSLKHWMAVNKIALSAAANSLEAVARDAGKSDMLDDIVSIKAYAKSRADVARKAILP
jgi:hypothetical protein